MTVSDLPDLNSPRPLAVFSDFDGTISHPDTLNFLAETFSSADFRLGIGKKIASGIQQEVAMIRRTLEEVLAFLRRHVKIDEAFPGFALWCCQKKVPLTILSAGIKDVIEKLLKVGSVFVFGGMKNVEFIEARYSCYSRQRCTRSLLS